MTDTLDDVRDTAERAHGSALVERLARIGLGARTLVWFVLGGLVLQLALGSSGGEQADQSGAFKTLADSRLGGLLLAVLALGFLIWAAYRLLCAAVGSRDEQGASRWGHRAKAGGEGLLYLLATVSAVRVLLGARADSEQEADSVTAAVMGVTGGRTLVGLAGVAVVVLGLVLVVRALERKHSKRLEHYRIPPSLRGPAVTVGVVGLVGRAGVVALIGAFLVNAAVRFDPDEAKGLDGALQVLAGQPYGRVLLGAVAVGVLGYALWSLVETLWRDL